VPGRLATPLATADQVFHALGDAHRRQMIEELTAGPRSVTALAAPFAISLAAVMQHLQVLEKSGLVKTQKTGRTRTCALNRDGFHAAEAWIRERRAAWERKFDRLEELLNE